MNDAERLNVPLIGPPEYNPLWDTRERHFDRSGNPITFREWASLVEAQGEEYKIVKQEEVGDFFVSTVWLGIDHQWGEIGNPLIFETMVFAKDGPEAFQDRYSTEEEALTGHANAKAKVEQGWFDTEEEEEEGLNENAVAFFTGYLIGFGIGAALVGAIWWVT